MVECLLLLVVDMIAEPLGGCGVMVIEGSKRCEVPQR